MSRSKISRLVVITSLIVAFLLTAVPVFASVYTVDINIKNDSSTDYSYLPIMVDVNNLFMKNQHMISSTGLDEIVKTYTGTSLQTMVASDRTIFAASPTANSESNYILSAGNTPVSSFPMMVGNSGLISTKNNVDLDLSNSFSVETTGRIKCTDVSGETIFSKPMSLECFASPFSAGTINAYAWTASNIGYTTLTGNGIGALASVPRVGERIAALTDSYVSSVKLALKKSSSVASGTITVRIRDSGTDAIVGTLGTIDASDLSLVAAWYTFTASVPFHAAGDVRLLVEFAGTGSVTVYGSGSDQTALGVATSYNGAAYTDDAGKDSNFQIFYLTATSVASTPASAGNYYQIGGGYNPSAGMRVGSFPERYVFGVQMHMMKVGSPTGTLYVNVRDTATDRILGTLGTLDVSTLTGAMAWVTFTPTSPVLVYGDVRVMAEYSGGSVGNGVYLGIAGVGAEAVLTSAGCYKSGSTGLYVEDVGNKASYQSMVLYTAVSVSSGGVSTGDHTVAVCISAGSLVLSIDGTAVASTGLGGASLQPTSRDWSCIGSSMPYCNKFTITVGGVEKVKYQPNTIVLGKTYSSGTVTSLVGSTSIIGTATSWTQYMVGSLLKITGDPAYYTVSSVTDATHLTLSSVMQSSLTTAAYNMYPTIPNRDSGGLYPGIITWGSNPSDVTVVYSTLMSNTTPVVAQPGQNTPVVNIIPEVTVSNWFRDPEVSTSLINNPLRPFVTILSNTTSMSESQAWRYFGILFVLAVLVSTARAIRGHYVITGAATATAILVCVVMTVFPIWALVFVIVAVIGGVIAERTPSL